MLTEFVNKMLLYHFSLYVFLSVHMGKNNILLITEFYCFSFPAGDFVAVIYDETWWVGEVAKVKEGKCLIQFMVRKGPNRFIWPEKVETDWLPKEGIFARFPTLPVPVCRRYVGFEQEAYLSVCSSVDKYLKKK